MEETTGLKKSKTQEGLHLLITVACYIQAVSLSRLSVAHHRVIALYSLNLLFRFELTLGGLNRGVTPLEEVWFLLYFSLAQFALVLVWGY